MPYALTEAVRKLSSKSPVASRLTSAEWERVPLEIRERAQFSARVESARVLQAIQDKLMSRISLARESAAGGAALVDRSSFIGDLRAIVQQEGLGTGTGTVTDLSSRRRLGLIFDMQTRQAQNYAKHKAGMDPDVLDAAPAQELIRVRQARAPRDWKRRWQDAGGRLIDGRMIALKTDPVWERISRFGTPYPPFDYGSGMGLKNIRRREAEKLGLIEPGQKITPAETPFNADLSASVKSLDPAIEQRLGSYFGDQVKNEDGRIKWQSDALEKLYDQALSPQPKGNLRLGFATAAAVEKALAGAGRNLEGTDFRISATELRHAIDHHGEPDALRPGSGERRRRQRALTREEASYLPQVWREPDQVEPGDDDRSLKFIKDLGGKRVLIVHERNPANSKAWGLRTAWIEEEEAAE